MREDMSGVGAQGTRQEERVNSKHEKAANGNSQIDIN